MGDVQLGKGIELKGSPKNRVWGSNSSSGELVLTINEHSVSIKSGEYLHQLSDY
jgi:hypothetical protein